MAFAPFHYDPAVEFERLLDNCAAPPCSPTNPPLTSSPSGDSLVIRPTMDAEEKDEENVVVITLEFPGLTKDDVTIDVVGDKLTVSAEKKRPHHAQHKQSKYTVRERQHGKLLRTLQLAPGVESSDIKASMADGLLTITFPRTSPQEQTDSVIVD
ncbi:17 class I heat shock protein [Grifola frondosa]|uniref:17 class I heat shock protein n=1 Tax=Grifola frondosa TaxID=5627 RepID=A0A1C7MUM7_GRIFR|nr:17 class I heat shock protein [Grifola frondosa]